ncbi:MAG: PspC domain-containing protein [Kineosporiaceae bacterium]|nr:PspC domain-containing protein [Kineosporiaceae bacterium]
MTNTPASRSLRRSDNRMIAGVCSGIAEYLGVDTTLVRVLTVVFALFGGAAVPIYLAAWVIMPDPRGDMIAARFVERLNAKRSEGRPVDVPNPYSASPQTQTHAPQAPQPSTPSTSAADTAHEPPAA